LWILYGPHSIHCVYGRTLQWNTDSKILYLIPKFHCRKNKNTTATIVVNPEMSKFYITTGQMLKTKRPLLINRKRESRYSLLFLRVGKFCRCGGGITRTVWNCRCTQSTLSGWNQSPRTARRAPDRPATQPLTLPSNGGRRLSSVVRRKPHVWLPWRRRQGLWLRQRLRARRPEPRSVSHRWMTSTTGRTTSSKDCHLSVPQYQLQTHMKACRYDTIFNLHLKTDRQAVSLI